MLAVNAVVVHLVSSLSAISCVTGLLLRTRVSWPMLQCLCVWHRMMCSGPILQRLDYGRDRDYRVYCMYLIGTRQGSGGPSTRLTL